MATRIQELAAILRLNMSQFERGVRGALSAAQKLGRGWNDVVQGIDKGATRIGIAVGAIGAAVGKVGFDFLRMRRRSEIALTQLLGDANKARKMLEELRELSTKSPLDFRILQQGAARLLNMGMAAERILPILRGVGDAVAAMGGDQQLGEQVIRALSQIQAKGKATAEEMTQQLGEVIPAWQFLADKLGVTVAEAFVLVEKGMVSADTTITAVLEGIERRSGGTAEKMSHEFDGVLKRLRVQFQEFSGRVVGPAFAAVDAGMRRLLAFSETDQFRQFTEGARAGVARLVDAVREAGPQILAMARAFGRVVTAVGEFLIQHPQLVAALVALKAAHILGVIQALSGLVQMTRVLSVEFATLAARAIPALIASIGTGLVAALGAAETAIMALGVSMGAAFNIAFFGIPALIAAIAGIGVAVFHWRDDIMAALGRVRDFVAAEFGPVWQEIADTFQQEVMPPLRELWKEIKAELLPVLRELWGFLKDAFVAILEMTAEALKQISNFGLLMFRESLKTTITVVRFLAVSALPLLILGLKTVASQLKVITFLLDNALGGWKLLLNLGSRRDPRTDQLNEQIEKLEKKLELEKQEIRNAQQRARMPAMPGGPRPAQAPDGGILERQKAEGIAKEIADAQMAAVDRDLPGFSQMMEFMARGPTEAQAAAFAGTMEGVSPGSAARFGSQAVGSAPNIQAELIKSLLREAMASLDRADAMKSADRDTDSFRNRLRQMTEAGDITDAQAEGFFTQKGGAVDLRMQLNSGAISIEQFRAGLQRLEEQANRTAQVNQTLAASQERMGALLGELKNRLPADQLNKFSTEFAMLRNALDSGKISLEQFNRGIRNMEQAARQAADAAEREARAKILRGDFRGLDRRKAMEDRLFQFRMGQFNQQMDAAFRRFLMLNGVIPNVAGAFGNLRDRMRQFSGALVGGVRGVGGQNLSQVMNTLFGFLSSRQGIIASLQNSIAFMRQRLSIVDSPRLKELIEKQIRAAELQIAFYSRPVRVFSGISGDPLFKDPGLQNGQTSGSVHVNLVLPNLTRMNNTDANNALNALAGAIARRGVPAFS